MNTQENKIYLIDTNIFLRVLINEDIQSHKECVELLKSIKSSRIKAFTNSVILSEISWTLLSFYKFSKEDVISALSGILNLNGLGIIDNYNHLQSLEIFSTKNVKYIDSLIASSANSIGANCTIVSYDKDFDKISGITRKEPKDIPISVR